MIKKWTRSIRIAVLLLVTLLLVALLPQTQHLKAANTLNVEITHSCSLQSDFGVLYSVKPNTDESLSNLRLHVEKQEFYSESAAYRWKEYDITDYTIKDGRYLFAFDGVNAVEMNSLVRATLYATKGSLLCYSDTDEFIVTDYVREILQKNQSSKNEKDKLLCTLCVDLLNQGAQAQQFFKINTSNLPNKGLTATQKGFASELPTNFTSKYSYTPRTGASCMIDALALSDSYDASIDAYMKFINQPSDDTYLEVTYKSVSEENKKITVPAKDFVYDQSIGYYSANITGVASADQKKVLTVVVKNNSKTLSGTYTTSIETCMKDIYSASPDELKTLLQQTMALSHSSENYFGYVEPIATPTPTPTKKVTPTPTKKATPTPTKKATPTPTKKATNTPTPTKKATNTPTPTKKGTNTPTPTKKATNTPTPTKKATNTPTPTKKATNTPTPTKKTTNTPTPTKKATNTPTPTKVATPTKTATVTPVPTAIHTEGYVTYRERGAKGDGVTDDYDKIIETHEYANANNLRVKADPGATYYIGHMDPKKPKGAVIKTDTDWTGATFFIDDKKMVWHIEKKKQMQPDGTYKEVDVVVMDDGECYLFTVEPTKPLEHVYLNSSGGVYLGLDPRLSANTTAAEAKNFMNKKMSKDTTLVDGEFTESALYILQTNSVRRWSRNGSAVSSNSIGKEQMEPVIVNKYDETDAKNHPGKSRIDSMTPFQWDWDKIYIIDKCPIDETLLQITGGTFITNVNNINTRDYAKHGISIQRSNVLMKNVEHLLAGEYGPDGQLNEGGKSVYSTPKVDPVTGEKKTVIYYPRTGAPYQGFFRMDHCAHVTLQNCVFSNHLRVYNNGDDTHSTAPYDFYAEYCVDLVIDGCHCAPTEEDLTGPADETGIMDKSRWGTTGTNYCKELTVQNHSSISRIDAHQGTYNMTVKDSTIGAWGVAAVGFGELRIDKSFIRSKEYLVKLRNDFGSAWFGDITITDTKWDIGTYYSAVLIYASYDPTYQYLYDTIHEDGMTYYSMLPENVNITNLTIDASKDTTGVFLRDKVSLYSTILPEIKDADNNYIQYDDSYFSNPNLYKFPLRCTKNLNLSGLTIIKAKNVARTSTEVVTQRVSTKNHTEYFTKKFGLKINYNETPKIVTAD